MGWRYRPMSRIQRRRRGQCRPGCANASWRRRMSWRGRRRDVDERRQRRRRPPRISRFRGRRDSGRDLRPGEIASADDKRQDKQGKPAAADHSRNGEQFWPLSLQQGFQFSCHLRFVQLTIPALDDIAGGIGKRILRSVGDAQLRPRVIQRRIVPIK